MISMWIALPVSVAALVLNTVLVQAVERRRARRAAAPVPESAAVPSPELPAAPGTGLTAVGSRGSLVVGGIHLPIVAISLSEGNLVITAMATGPMPEATGCPVIFGSDGQGVAGGDQEFTLAALREDERGVLTFRMRIASLRSDAG